MASNTTMYINAQGFFFPITNTIQIDVCNKTTEWVVHESLTEDNNSFMNLKQNSTAH